METYILSGVAVLISIVGLLMTGRKDTRAEASNNAKVEAKLDSISGGVEDIRVEIRSMRTRMDSFSERLAYVESSCKAAHHRLDQLQAHPPDNGQN